jgi:GLPGLI family protein
MKKGIILFALFVAVTSSQAQENFFPAIRVEFDKTVSVRALYKELEENSSWFQQWQDRYPVTAISQFVFIGDTAHSLYQPAKEVVQDPRAFYRPLADRNIVYTDYKKNITISQKPVFEETFLMEDSLLKIKWKLTGDIRTIAGFDCRKAIGILNDSIAVFAFYTDELMVQGGPEGIHGLPGMILGVGIPRLHTTWFATRVEVNGVNLASISPAKKGKKVNRAAMMQSLERVLKQWGTYGSKMIVTFAI